MNIYYFGADKPWEELLQFGFRRRNTCILKALVESRHTDKVYVIRKTTRSEFLKQLFKKKDRSGKVQDIYFASLLPERGLQKIGLGKISRRLNAFLLRRMCSGSKAGDVLWAYWPKAWFSAMSSGLRGTVVFDADHNIIDDPSISPAERPQREKDLLEIAAGSHYLLSSTRSMLGWFSDRGFDNGVLLRNGVDAARFQSAVRTEDKEGFTIGYCGTLSRWIDYELFAALARKNPQWKFVIIGKPHLTEDWRVLEGLPNVHLLGEKKAAEVVTLIPTFDAALNLYRKHPALDVDSMKLYEYIAAGVPVVSTRFHDCLVQDFEDILLLGDDLDSIGQLLKCLEKGESPAKTAKTTGFLQRSAWHKRVDEFLTTLNPIHEE
ncbi:MAG TPA: glycosyltransferase [Bryobacteraceae bacterium]